MFPHPVERTERLKTAVIIGASTGIGLSACKELSREGFYVLGTARDDAGERAVIGAGGTPIRLELREKESIEGAIQNILAESERRIDVLILNAGIGQPGAIEDVPIESVRDTFEVNVFGPLQLLQRLLPYMIEQKQGRVIWIGSVLGFISMGFRGTYAATKHSIEAMADSLAIELEGTGVSVSVVQPGPVATNFRPTAKKRFDAIWKEGLRLEARYSQFDKRLSKPDVVGGDTVSAALAGQVIARAATAKKMRARYRICFSTTCMELIRRIFPRGVMRRISVATWKIETGA